MDLNIEQEKAVKALVKALNNVGKLGLWGGVYDTSFMIGHCGKDRAEVVEEICAGNEVNGRSLHTPHIQLDGGAGV